MSMSNSRNISSMCAHTGICNKLNILLYAACTHLFCFLSPWYCINNSYTLILPPMSTTAKNIFIQNQRGTNWYN